MSAACISILWYATRRQSPWILAAGWMAILGFAAIASWRAMDVLYGEFSMVILGLALYGAGLGIVRVLLARSVSLRLLSRCAGFRTSEVDEQFRSRLADITRYGLGTSAHGRYRLTGLGQAVARVLGWVSPLGGCHVDE